MWRANASPSSDEDEGSADAETGIEMFAGFVGGRSRDTMRQDESKKDIVHVNSTALTVTPLTLTGRGHMKKQKIAKKKLKAKVPTTTRL